MIIARRSLYNEHILCIKIGKERAIGTDMSDISKKICE